METDKKYKGFSCIYKILNKINGKVYVGKTTCLVQRTYNYNSDFRNDGKRLNDYLYRAMVKYGYDNFEISPIEFCKTNELAEKELSWILKLRSNERNFGYNLRLDSSTGMIASIETSLKISENLKLQWESGIRDDHGKKITQTMLNFSPDKKKSISEQLKKIKTKYKYLVTDEYGITNSYFYQELKPLKLHLVLGKICRHKLNKVNYKGFVIERVRI